MENIDNQKVRKVIIKQPNGEEKVLINLGKTTATPKDVADGKLFFTRRGEFTVGTGGTDTDTEDLKIGSLVVYGNGEYYEPEDYGLDAWNSIFVNVDGLPNISETNVTSKDLRKGSVAYTKYGGLVYGEIVSYPESLSESAISGPAKGDEESKGYIKIDLNQPVGQVFYTENKYTDKNIYIKPSLRKVSADEITLSANRQTTININDTIEVNGKIQKKYGNHVGFEQIVIPKVEAFEGTLQQQKHGTSTFKPPEGQFYSSIKLLAPNTKEFTFDPKTKDELLAGVIKKQLTPENDDALYFNTVNVKTIPDNKRARLRVFPVRNGQGQRLYKPEDCIENNIVDYSRMGITFEPLTSGIELDANGGWFFEEVVVDEIPQNYAILLPEDRVQTITENNKKIYVGEYQYVIAEVPILYRQETEEEKSFIIPNSQEQTIPSRIEQNAQGQEVRVFPNFVVLPVPLYTENEDNNYLYIGDHKGENDPQVVNVRTESVTFPVDGHTHIKVETSPLEGTLDKPVGKEFATNSQLLAGYVAWADKQELSGEIKTYNGEFYPINSSGTNKVPGVEIECDSPNGVVLQAKTHYCDNDVVVTPKLLSKTFTYPAEEEDGANGEKIWYRVEENTWRISDINAEGESFSGFKDITIQLPPIYQIVQGTLSINKYSDEPIDVAKYAMVDLKVAALPYEVSSYSTMIEMLEGKGTDGGMYLYSATSQDGFENGVLYFFEEITEEVS